MPQSPNATIAKFWYFYPLSEFCWALPLEALSIGLQPIFWNFLNPIGYKYMKPSYIVCEDAKYDSAVVQNTSLVMLMSNSLLNVNCSLTLTKTTAAVSGM